MEKNKVILKALKKRKTEGKYRSLSSSFGLIDFCSNDYLGVAKDRDLHQLVLNRLTAQNEIDLGSGGSRLLAGNHAFYESLESEMATLYRAESSLFFNSGYTANLSIFSAIPQKKDTILYDEFIHTCVKDGARLSPAKRLPFKHNDVEDLAAKLDRIEQGNIYVAIESVYSMDGDFAKVKEIADLCSQKDAYLIVDEAHSTGLYGSSGEGYCVEQGVDKLVWCRVHTFGKAIGVHGACVAGSKELTQYLINFARPFIYTTASSPHHVLTVQEALNHVKLLQERRDELRKKITLFQSLVNQPAKSNTPIQVVIIEGNDNVKQVAKNIQNEGFDVRAILSPTVKEGTERLRICLHSFNTDNEIKDLVKLIHQFK